MLFRYSMSCIYSPFSSFLLPISYAGKIHYAPTSRTFHKINKRPDVFQSFTIIADLTFLNIAKSLLQCLLFLIPQNNIGLSHIHHLDIQITTLSAVDAV